MVRSALHLQRPAFLSAASALLLFVAWQALALLRAGVFEYPLDDVYIHLAMAEGIANGTYGINPGEPAAAASSIAYPLLLLPFAGTEVQRYLPLLWNAAGLVALAWLFGRHVAQSDLTRGHGRGLAIALAVLVPFGLNMANVAALGMEHTLHALTALVVATGLWSFLGTGRISPALVVATVAGPLLRFEALALSLLVVLVILWEGHVRTGLLLLAGAAVPVALFSAFLMSLGLSPMPSSVLVKIAGHAGDFSVLGKFVVSLQESAVMPVYIGFALFTLVALWPSGDRPQALAMFLRVIWLACLAHLIAGQVGWLNRYEHYLMVLMGVAAVPLVAASSVWVGRLAVLALALSGAVYAQVNATIYAWNPRAIHLQQAQMARLTEFLPGEAVAVNDIGWVSWRHSAPVLDLWGLASADARAARAPENIGGKPRTEWAGQLVENKGVRYAMIYDRWIGEGIGRDWRKVADLTITGAQGRLGGPVVGIYATDPDFEPALRAAVREFAATLPSGAELHWHETLQ